MPDALPTPLSKGRVLSSALLVAGIGALQLATEFLGTHDAARLASKSLALLLGLPILVGCAAAVFRHPRSKRFGLIAALFVGAVVAGLFFAALLRAARTAVVSFILAPSSEDLFGERDVLRVGFMMGMTYFALWAVTFLLPAFAEDVRARVSEADKLRAQAELAQLRSQLDPHFLLNTLNAIAGLVTDDPRQARRLLGNLGDLLRDSMLPEKETETLQAQIEWLRRYAQILEARHLGQLAFHWDIGAGTPSTLLPRLLLQPLVENAVKHGALRRAGGGEITVRTKLDGARLVCTVEDNGPGVPNGAARPGAFGLLSVRRRLELRYGGEGTLRLESTTAGTRSIVELPVQAEGE